jgi:methionine sulfoxide reductase heme-binding subunit
MPASEIQIPWDWYIVRASALMGFLLLYISVFFGTVSCLPGIRKYFLRLRSLNFHCWISFQALLFATMHAVALLFHKFIPFGWKDILIPFHSNFEPELVALGIFGLYLMIILVATSYARKYISAGLWRGIHFLNMGLYIAVIIHALYLGTDLKSGLLREIFIWANGILLALLIFNMIWRIWSRRKNQPIICETPNANENLRPGNPAVREERNPGNFQRRI